MVGRSLVHSDHATPLLLQKTTVYPERRHVWDLTWIDPQGVMAYTQAGFTIWDYLAFFEKQATELFRKVTEHSEDFPYHVEINFITLPVQTT